MRLAVFHHGTPDGVGVGRIERFVERHDAEIVSFLGGGSDSRHAARRKARRLGRSLQTKAAHEIGDRFHRSYRGRQRDALELARQPRETFDGGHQMHTPLRIEHAVHLVQQYRPDPTQNRASPFRTQHQVQTLRCRNQNLGWLTQHTPAVGLWRVAAPCEDPNVRKHLVGFVENRPKRLKRRQEVSLNVVVECL